MKRSVAVLIAVVICLTAPALAQTEAKLNLQATSGGTPIPNHYIVVLKDGADPREVMRRHVTTASYIYTKVLNGFAAELNASQLQQVLRDDDVAYVDEDGVAQLVQANPGSVQAVPDAQGQDAQGDVGVSTVQPGATWGIDKTDQQWAGPANGSYNYTDNGLGVNVYIADTGIRTTHNEFDGAGLNRAKAGSLGFDAFGGNGQDCHGHGTHVAGTVGGTVYGVAKAVKLYAVRVLDCSGSGSWAGVIAGVEWITNNHVKPAVANASLGGGYVQAVNDAITKSVSWGVTWVVAAGNSNLNACSFSPAATPTAITVGATDSGNAKAGFSNHGPCVDIHGPGVGITSAWIGSDFATNTISGTSMASPHVAGLAALYHKALPTAAPGQVTDALLHSGVRNVVTGLPGGTVNLSAHKVNGTHDGVNNPPGTTCDNQEPDVFPGQCYYFSATPGVHHVFLRGTPGTNFNLQFYRWNGTSWVLVAQKIGGSPNEYLKYNGLGGFFYMFVVTTTGGGGTYDAWVIKDGMTAS